MTPWIWVTLGSLAILSGVDVWREDGPSSLQLLQGTLPNLVAVPALTFGFLMMRVPTRPVRTSATERLQRRWFRGLWAVNVAGVVAWEFLQRTGRLVFDPLDLVATALGAGAALVLFRILEPRSYAPADREGR